MSKFSKTVLAGLLSAALFAVPAMAQKDGSGVQVGSGKAAGGSGKVSGGGGGNRAVSGGGGGGNFRAHSNTTRSPGTVRSTPRSSGVVINQNRTVIRDRTIIRDRNVGGSRIVEHRRHHRGTRYLWGGLPFYFYDGYYHGDCGWLRRRAEITGSRYWWIRYRQCREDD